MTSCAALPPRISLESGPGHTLQPTGLAYEAYLRLIDGGGRRFADRTHFFRAAAKAMRGILTDHDRHRASLKAGGEWQRVTFIGAEPAIRGVNIDLLALHEALRKLALADPRKVELVPMRFFGGVSGEEAAGAGISPSTADNDWSYARV